MGKHICKQLSKTALKTGKAVALICGFLISTYAVADISTLTNYTGDWSNSASWNGGNTPNPIVTDVANSENIDIYGYITREGSLSFANLGNNSYKLTVYDTLVVAGDLSFANNAISLEVASGGVLVVFGDFVANNKVDLDNGGTMVITGDMTLNGGNQDYTDTGGNLYVDGSISGNGDVAAADAVDQPSFNLDGGNSEEQALFEFVNEGGTAPLPITLGSFSAFSHNYSVEIEWTTITEENFSHFEIQRSLDGNNFEVIGIVDGHVFSNTERNYFYVDANPIIGRSYYRLNAVDIDGSLEVFESISIVHGMDNININMISLSGGNATLRIHTGHHPVNQRVWIYNINGKIIFESSDVQNELNFFHDQLSQILIAKVQIDGMVLTKKFLIN